MEKQTSIKVSSAAVRKAKQVKKKTGIAIGRQFELAYALYLLSLEPRIEGNN
jgi:hypothetical protein